MSETREARRAILHSAVEQFLDHLAEDVDAAEHAAELGAVVIAAEVHGDVAGEPTSYPTFWCSNESRIFQRGFFAILDDYGRLEDGDEDGDE